MNLSLDDVLKATGGRLVAGEARAAFTGVTTDTRDLRAGSLYVPLKGERFDGHDFLDRAKAAGASGVLVSRDDASLPEGLSAVRVEDTLAAYGDIARHHREQLGLTVVAVTGSSGKTSTKEAVAAFLGRFMRVGKTHANFNNEIGVPKTLLSMTPSDEAVVVEMGMRGPGEIAYLASVARPDVGIITNVGTAHIGRLGTQEAIARAKGELLRVGGPAMAAVLNADDPLVMAQAEGHAGALVTYGLRPGTATVWAEGDGLTFDACYQAGPRQREGRMRLSLPMAGAHHRSNALAAVAVAWHLGLALPEAFCFAPSDLPGRAHVLRLGDVEVVDETYNANPESVRSALAGFCAEPCAGRRIAVLGEMGELGTYAEVGHRAVGDAVRDLPIDRAFTVGEMGRWIADQAPGKTLHFPDKPALIAALLEAVEGGDRVFVKGSRSTRMEEIVQALSHHLGGHPA
ncbi:MAG TPA: UDP-N-acetylmuramoyl-tripeptide--D-alanyl-D-alanine ligase [Pantanalinema sp.]